MPQGSRSRSADAAQRIQLELPLAKSAVQHGINQPAINVRVSARARHLQIKVSPWKGVDVIVPRRRSQKEVAQFLASHREWIDRAWAKLLQEYPKAGQLRLPERVVLDASGECWRVSAEGTRYSLRKREQRVCIPAGLTVNEQALALQKLVRDRAAEWLPQRMQRWIERTGLEPAKLAIRGQQSRWGSCSSKGTISLNFRLMFLEPHVVDCLLLHELCHLKHPNHGKRFWALNAKFMPDVRERDRELGDSWKRVPAWALVRE